MDDLKAVYRHRRVAAVIPAYNEGQRIGKVIEDTLNFVDMIVVANDGSEDNTSEISRSKGALVIDLATNRGVGFATRVACERALAEGADIIVTIDADGQHDPLDIPKLISYLVEEGLDIVFGCRQRNTDIPFGRRLGNMFLSLIAKIFFKVEINDCLTGFHAFTRECYPKLRWDSSGYDVVLEFVFRIAKNNLKYREVPVKTIYNVKETGMRKRDGIRSILKMILWRIKEYP